VQSRASSLPGVVQREVSSSHRHSHRPSRSVSLRCYRQATPKVEGCRQVRVQVRALDTELVPEYLARSSWSSRSTKVAVSTRFAPQSREPDRHMKPEMTQRSTRWDCTLAKVRLSWPVRRLTRATVELAVLAFACTDPMAAAAEGREPWRLITLDPGHFHAALFQRQMLPGVSERVHVYAPLGPDLLAHLGRIAQFNGRSDRPTSWQLEVHAGPDYFARLLRERPGEIAVLSGRNGGKVDRLLALVGSGLHVLADKPWILETSDLPKLEALVQVAQRQRLVVYDAMTQRYEIAYQLARELVQDRQIFGGCLPGSPEEPSVFFASVHYLLKEVAGQPLLRPTWFFDIHQLGEGLTDVGTHLVDLVAWILLPGQTLDWRRDLEVFRGQRWPTRLTREQFALVTGASDFPDFLAGAVRERQLEYYANNSVFYALRGHHVRLEVQWEFAAPPGGKDTELAIFRGRLARIEVRQAAADNYQPNVFIVPRPGQDHEPIWAALQRKFAGLESAYPDIAVAREGDGFRLVIPDRYRVGHEAHFGVLTRVFLDYVQNPDALPSWELPNLLAKYYVTTKGVELARQQPARPNP